MVMLLYDCVRHLSMRSLYPRSVGMIVSPRLWMSYVVIVPNLHHCIALAYLDHGDKEAYERTRRSESDAPRMKSRLFIHICSSGALEGHTPAQSGVFSLVARRATSRQERLNVVESQEAA